MSRFEITFGNSFFRGRLTVRNAATLNYADSHDEASTTQINIHIKMLEPHAVEVSIWYHSKLSSKISTSSVPCLQYQVINIYFDSTNLL
uniref:Uncharacterized protein n=1 Tax=Physcomitrium patens TaxID=3218 RepID=A0A2K1INR8_PHYPA|nr:hypothetical protein PHYPA_027239 [Physcomitrium patens]